MYTRRRGLDLLGVSDVVRIYAHCGGNLVAGLWGALNLRNAFLTFFRSAALACLRFGGKFLGKFLGEFLGEFHPVGSRLAGGEVPAP